MNNFLSIKLYNNKSLKDIFFSTNGRLSVDEFWMYNLLLGVLSIVFEFGCKTAIWFIRGGYNDLGNYSILQLSLWNIFDVLDLALIILVIVMSIFVLIKRAHDLGKSGSWLLFGLIPVYNIYVSGLLAFGKGEKKDNEYGLLEEKKFPVSAYFILVLSLVAVLGWYAISDSALLFYNDRPLIQFNKWISEHEDIAHKLDTSDKFYNSAYDQMKIIVDRKLGCDCYGENASQTPKGSLDANFWDGIYAEFEGVLLEMNNGNLSPKGEKQGIAYYENGNVKLSGNYLDSQKDGTWYYYSESGNLIGIENYVKGEKDGEQITYYEDGAIKSKDNYAKGKLQDDQYTYFKNGDIESKKSYYNGLLSGEVLEYYENGNKKIKNNYVKGEKDGWQGEYYENGKIKSVERYNRGSLDGEQVSYYENGNIKTRKNYKDGSRDGIYSEYNEEGKLTKFKLYKRNSLVNYSEMEIDPSIYGGGSTVTQIENDFISIAHEWKSLKDENSYPYPKDLSNTGEVSEYYKAMGNNIYGLYFHQSLNFPEANIETQNDISGSTRKYKNGLVSLLAAIQDGDIEKSITYHLTLKDIVTERYNDKDGSCNKACQKIVGIEDKFIENYKKQGIDFDSLITPSKN